MADEIQDFKGYGNQEQVGYRVYKDSSTDLQIANIGDCILCRRWIPLWYRSWVCCKESNENSCSSYWFVSSGSGGSGSGGGSGPSQPTTMG